MNCSCRPFLDSNADLKVKGLVVSQLTSQYEVHTNLNNLKFRLNSSSLTQVDQFVIVHAYKVQRMFRFAANDANAMRRFEQLLDAVRVDRIEFLTA